MSLVGQIDDAVDCDRVINRVRHRLGKSARVVHNVVCLARFDDELFVHQVRNFDGEGVDPLAALRELVLELDSDHRARCDFQNLRPISGAEGRVRRICLEVSSHALDEGRNRF